MLISDRKEDKYETLGKAEKAIEAAEDKAGELGTTVSIVIVDNHGSIIAISKMDHALIISPKFAISKAYTAANLGFATGDLSQYASEGKPYFGINTLFGGKFDLLAGGVPVKRSDKVVGGVGVGGSPDTNQDVECAKAAAAVLEE